MFLKSGLLALAVALAACSSLDDEREWMKVNERYTVQEFQRDHAACTKAGKLDDVCMRSRGWVDVSNRKGVEKVPDRAKLPGARN